jgi:hypothetical protein
MKSEPLAYAILQAVAHLHQCGHGRLRIRCYIKDGLCAWRHQLFVSDRFEIGNGSSTALYSIPGRPIAVGSDFLEIANKIAARYPELVNEAIGPVNTYTSWLQTIVTKYPQCVLEMETPTEAMIDGVKISTPYSSESYRKIP